MGFVRGIVERRDFFSDLLKYRQAGAYSDTDAGIRVTPDTAMTYSALFAGIRVLSDGVASLPCKVYERTGGDSRREARENEMYPILHHRPNPEMTAIEFYGMLQGHAVGRGNGYAQIVRNYGGSVLELWPLNPSRMEVRRQDRGGELRYVYTPTTGGADTYSRGEILHVRGLMGNGMTGYSVITLARNAIALGLATEKHGGRIFKNGSRPAAVLKHPGKLSEAAEQNILSSFEARHKGVENTGLMGILAEGMTIESIGFNAQDSQFLETRQHQVADIARWLGLPPHMIGELSKSTNNNIEQQSLELVIYSIRPWLVRWEQALYAAFFSGTDYFSEFNIDGLVRGDMQTRYAAYAVGKQWGFLSANDIRAKENMNPVDGGDIYMMPLNMIPATDAGAANAPSPAARGACGCGHEHRSDETREDKTKREIRSRYAKNRSKLREQYAPMFREMAARIVKREEADVMRKARKALGSRSAEDLLVWLEDFYKNDMPEYAQKQAAPVYQSFITAVNESAASQGGLDSATEDQIMEWTQQYTERFGTGYTLDSLRKLQSILAESKDPLAGLQSQFDDWQENRPEKTYLFSSVCLIGAVAGATWLNGGFTREVWVSSGGCPICQEMDGKTASIEGTFIDAGSDMDIGDGKTTTISRDIFHPPLHTWPGECVCDVAPES